MLAKCSSNTVDKDIRNCLVGYIPRSHWINGVLDYYIRAANNDVFNFDIKNWYDDLNFLFYDGKGSGYKWHSDIDVPLMMLVFVNYLLFYLLVVKKIMKVVSFKFF